MINKNQFPQDFLWGTATASYQVEGAAKIDDRGPSIWDTFCTLPGRVDNDDNGDIAIDQYHRYKEDVQLMKELGISAYRFSISWSRIFPKGYGDVNWKGVDYYNALIDELLSNGITPYVTFFHWDLPQALEEEFGGWRSRKTAELFADYVAFMTKLISDRVTNFFTINEFLCFTDHGYYGGDKAPGLDLWKKVRNEVRHNALLAHGMAVNAIRANAKQPVEVGLADNPMITVPIVETAEHIEATRKAFREINAPFLTAVLEGTYIDEYKEAEGEDMPDYSEQDMKIISTPLDFVGLNIYAPTVIRSADNGKGWEVVNPPTSYPRYDTNWLYFDPRIAYWGPKHLLELWGVKKIYITENGAACRDQLTHDKKIYDTDRILYLRNHFLHAQKAINEGIPLKGYFVWSMFDNFEWAEGYNKRFGIVYVNYNTLERIPKESFQFYKKVIRSGKLL